MPQAEGTEAAADRPGFQLAEGQVELALGQQQVAEDTFKQLLLGHPLSPEAQTARAKLTQMGAESTLTVAELRSLGDAYYNAGRYAEAAEQFRALAREPGLDAETRNGFAVAEAACELKLKRLTPAQVQGLPDTDDENGARRLDLSDGTGPRPRRHCRSAAHRLRDGDEVSAQPVAGRRAVFQRQHVPAQARLPHGDRVLQRSGQALSRRQECGRRALALGLAELPAGPLRDAARIFDEQIQLYPAATETVSALYWRGRLYETQDHNPALAAANYRTIVRVYQHYFYAQMARERLAALLGKTAPRVLQAERHKDGRTRNSIHSSPCRSRTWSIPFLRTARTWPRRGCWPMRA